MKRTMNTSGRCRGAGWLIVASLALAAPTLAHAGSGDAGPEPTPSPTPAATAEDTAPKTEPGPRMDIYGFAMLDMGYQSKQNDPDWFDVVRPTKLPAFDGEFGEGGDFWMGGVRQSRLGFKSSTDTKYGRPENDFEFELSGVGSDAGQTTFRLCHAWGELGEFGAGQTWSPFMDPDVFPNSIETGVQRHGVFPKCSVALDTLGGWRLQLYDCAQRPGASGDWE